MWFMQFIITCQASASSMGPATRIFFSVRGQNSICKIHKTQSTPNLTVGYAAPPFSLRQRKHT